MKPIIMTDTIPAVDTNVLIYLHDKSNKGKRVAAENILAANPKVPAQVVSEYLNTTRRLLNLSKTELILQCAELFKDCEILPVTVDTLLSAARLIKKYDFQLFDSIIVATALDNGCPILYSEDMQHELLVEKRLTILNPFI